MIFYEKEEAEKILKNGFSSFMSFEELSLLAKYFKYLGKNKPQIKKSLIEFCEKHNDDFNQVLARKTIDNAIKNSQKYSLRMKINVNITEDEFEIIRHYGDYKHQKILFVMLAIAKYFKYNNTRIKEKLPSKYDDNFYVNEKTTNIFKLAKVNVTKKDRNKIIFELEQSGLIETTFVGSEKINFIDNDSPVKIIIDDMNHVIDFFPYFCEECGKQISIKAKKHNLCNDCYQEHLKVLWADSSRKYRNKKPS